MLADTDTISSLEKNGSLSEVTC